MEQEFSDACMGSEGEDDRDVAEPPAPVSLAQIEGEDSASDESCGSAKRTSKALSSGGSRKGHGRLQHKGKAGASVKGKVGKKRCTGCNQYLPLAEFPAGKATMGMKQVVSRFVLCGGDVDEEEGDGIGSCTTGWQSSQLVVRGGVDG